MDNLLHVGMHILEKDLEPFYKNVLGCRIESKFQLEPEDSFCIFGIKQSVGVYYATSNGIELELFVGSKIDTPTFRHICYQSFEVEKIMNKAKELGYYTFIREKNSHKTFFIRDSNFNLFEIKNLAK
jgi:hypothetical protein